MSEHTPLYILSKRIVDEIHRDIFDRLMKWRMFSAEWKLEIEDYYGKPIRYRGIKFDGSPRLVFWKGFIEPFLENGITKSLDELLKICNERNIDFNDYIAEMTDLLRSLIVSTYEYMADIDQVLRGGGNIRSVTKVNVSDKIVKMDNYLANYLAAVSHRNPKKIENKEELIGLKPSFYGISIDLKVLWRKMKTLFHGT